MTTYTQTPLNGWIKSKIGLPAHRELTRQALLAYQLERLWITLDYVIRCSPFYRHHLAGHTVESLQSEMATLSQYPGRKSIPSGQIKSIWLGTQNRLQCVAGDIGQAWDCRVFQHYGTAEMCPGGGVQCRVRDGFHLREADLLIEIVNPDTAKPVADGVLGEVVVTTLTREAMPLVRYRTGHGATVMTAPCPCGTVLRRLYILPKKFFDNPLSKGKFEGAVLDREKFEQMNDEYYDQRGWDPKRGIPTRKKLMELGLEEKF